MAPLPRPVLPFKSSRTAFWLVIGSLNMSIDPPATPLRVNVARPDEMPVTAPLAEAWQLGLGAAKFAPTHDDQVPSEFTLTVPK